MAKCLEDGGLDGLRALLQEGHARTARELCAEVMACYLCGGCGEPFCGGRVDCAADLALDPVQLKCPPCAFKAQQDAHKCREHGYK